MGSVSFFFSVFLSFKTLFHLLFSSESSFIPLIPLRVKLARNTAKGKKALLLGEQVDEQYPHPALTYRLTHSTDSDWLHPSNVKCKVNALFAQNRNKTFLLVIVKIFFIQP